MHHLRAVFAAIIAAALGLAVFAGAPVVTVNVVRSDHAMVVAGHPEAAEIGAEVLRAGGNAIDAAVAVSLALGVAEPYGSGLGGKLMLLYYNATVGQTFVVDAMDAAPTSLDVAMARQWTSAERSTGWKSIAVPGLPAGLDAAHRRWGSLPWSEVVEPARALAQQGARVEPKTQTLFAERLDRLRNDPDLARVFLRGGEVPEVGVRLPNPDMAETLRRLGEAGGVSFYRGELGQQISAAILAGGGGITPNDLASYRVRIIQPMRMSFREFEIVTSPPPSTGAAMFLPVMKALETALDLDLPLRDPENLSLVGQVWREVQPRIYAEIADTLDAVTRFEALLDDDYIAALRAKIGLGGESGLVPALEDTNASTTHFVIVDAAGNIVSATQSLSLHFGAGVVVPGTGIILNDSMSNFSYSDADSPNAVAAGQRPRSTISPTIVFENGQPRLALGLPGGSRIPTAMLQVLLDRLTWHRPLEEAIGDVRIHFNPAWRNGGVDALEVESGLDLEVIQALSNRGWTVEIKEPAGQGLHFGGVNAIEFEAGGGLSGFADPRRSNWATGY